MATKSKNMTPRKPSKGPKFERELPCKLTDEELLVKALELTKLDAKHDALQLEKKRLTEEIAGKIKANLGAQRVLFGQIGSRREVRDVECQDTLDFDRGIVETRRLDTDEVIHSRVMTDIERQPALPGFRIAPLEGSLEDFVPKDDPNEPKGPEGDRP